MSCTTGGSKHIVGSYMRSAGAAPADKKLEGTQADTRRVEVVRYCEDHRPRSVARVAGGRG